MSKAEPQVAFTANGPAECAPRMQQQEPELAYGRMLKLSPGNSEQSHALGFPETLNSCTPEGPLSPYRV